MRRVALAAVILLAAACRGDGAARDSMLEVSLRVSPTPPTVGEARLVVSIADSGGLAVEGVDVEVEGSMLHPGMVPVFERAEEEGDGRYVVSGFPFSMGGDWVLTTRVRRGEEVLDVRDHPVRVVGRGAAPVLDHDSLSP